MVEKVGFIGLGIMGKPMALNLIKAGFPLTVYNRTPGKTKDLQEAGAQVAASPAEAAAASDIIITIVGDAPDVKEVIDGSQGVIQGCRPGQVVIDMSTIPPQTVREVAEALADKNVDMLDAPVSGGEGGAIAGTLSIMVGGQAPVFERCLPVFKAMGQNIVHVGDIGAGQGAKLCNQVICSLTLLATCEGLILAAKAGLDPEKVLEAIASGAAQSWTLSNQAPKIINGDFSPGFMVKHQRKDLRAVMETAAQLGVSLPGTGLVYQLYNTLADQEYQEMGNQSLIWALERLAGVEARRTKYDPWGDFFGDCHRQAH